MVTDEYQRLSFNLIDFMSTLDQKTFMIVPSFNYITKYNKSLQKLRSEKKLSFLAY